MFLTVNKDVLTMLMTSLARDDSALGSIEVEVEVEVEENQTSAGFCRLYWRKMHSHQSQHKHASQE